MNSRETLDRRVTLLEIRVGTLERLIGARLREEAEAREEIYKAPRLGPFGKR